METRRHTSICYNLRAIAPYNNTSTMSTFAPRGVRRVSYQRRYAAPAPHLNDDVWVS